MPTYVQLQVTDSPLRRIVKLPGPVTSYVDGQDFVDWQDPDGEMLPERQLSRTLGDLGLNPDNYDASPRAVFESEHGDLDQIYNAILIDPHAQAVLLVALRHDHENEWETLLDATAVLNRGLLGGPYMGVGPDNALALPGQRFFQIKAPFLVRDTFDPNMLAIIGGKFLITAYGPEGETLSVDPLKPEHLEVIWRDDLEYDGPRHELVHEHSRLQGREVAVMKLGAYFRKRVS